MNHYDTFERVNTMAGATKDHPAIVITTLLALFDTPATTGTTVTRCKECKGVGIKSYWVGPSPCSTCGGLGFLVRRRPKGGVDA